MQPKLEYSAQNVFASNMEDDFIQFHQTVEQLPEIESKYGQMDWSYYP